MHQPCQVKTGKKCHLKNPVSTWRNHPSGHPCVEIARINYREMGKKRLQFVGISLDEHRLA